MNELVSGLSGDTSYHWRARLLYDPVTVPFKPASRWLSMPRAARQEAMLRTASLSAGSVDALLLGKSADDEITLSWAESCLATDSDYAIYDGGFADHLPILCSTAGETTSTFAPTVGNTYYLVVPRNGSREGSYGIGNGAERPAGEGACLPQQISPCE